MNRRSDLNRSRRVAKLLPVLLFVISLAVADRAAGQIPFFPYVQDFNSGSPLLKDWMSANGAEAIWTYSDTIGVGASGGMIIDMGNTSTFDTAFLYTPAFNISALENPGLRFRVALIQNNFVPPILTLFADDGGDWKRLGAWGLSGFMEPSPEEIETTDNFGTPLRRENIEWVTITMPLDAVATETNVRFVFEGRMVNGGWLLLDDFSVVNLSLAGTESEPTYSSSFGNVALFPNPTRAAMTLQFDQSITTHADDALTLQFIDPLGRVLRAEPVNAGATRHETDVATFPAGFYLLRLVDKTNRTCWSGSVVVE